MSSAKKRAKLKEGRKRKLSEMSQVLPEWRKATQVLFDSAKTTDAADNGLDAASASGGPPRVFDVRFQVKCALSGDNCEVPSVKSLLAIHSKVFDAMFFGDFAEAKSKENGTVHVPIPDCSKEAMEAINAYVLHCHDSVILNTENIGAVLYASTKYVIEGLQKGCKQYLMDATKKKPVSNALVKILFSLDKWRMADASTSVVSKMDFKTLENVLNCDMTITAPMPERALMETVAKITSVTTKCTSNAESCFKVVRKWATHQLESAAQKSDSGLDEPTLVELIEYNTTRMEEIMAPFVPCLNCPAMGYCFFASEVCCYDGLLNAEQMVDVFKKIAERVSRERLENDSDSDLDSDGYCPQTLLLPDVLR